MELVTGIEPVTLSLPRIRSADWATPAQWTFTSLANICGCGDRTWTCDLRVMSPTSYQLLHPAIDGGGRRIRTFEVEDGRFTVCSLWPLGNPSINKMELAIGIEPTTCWLQVSCSTYWATPASLRQDAFLSSATLSVKNFLNFLKSFVRSLRSPLVLYQYIMKVFYDASIFLKFF